MRSASSTRFHRRPSRPRPLATALAIVAPLALAIAAAAAPRPPAPSSPPKAPRPVDFNHDVLPILSNNCFLCHGMDSNRRMAALRLDRPDAAVAKLPSGKTAIVPGDAGASELVARITATNALKMPPAASGKKLTPAQITTLRRWVAEGAHYAPHWSYASVQRPALPALPSDPQLRTWARNPIDRFILARLVKEHLKPSPEADRRTLIRRLSLDLLGLPPKPGEVAAFVKDRRPRAYERLVDRYLASPHFGERLAQYWLDLARYADTVGYHGDQDVTVWPYRDYVIRSFNENKPFDKFTREQLAGDLMPGHGPEQLVASGYNRLGMMSAEGGVQDKEYRAKYAADRVRNLSSVWLGSTLQCAECHDHKFDPFTQKDFYSCEAFFADLKEQGFYGGGYSQGDWGPSARVPTDAQKAELARLDGAVAEAKKAVEAVPEAALASGQAKWEAAIRALDAAKGLGWNVATPAAATSSGGSTMTVQPGGAVFVSGKVPDFDTYTVTLPVTQSRVTAIRLETLPDGALAGNDIARAGYTFILSEFEAAVQKGEGPVQPVKLATADVDQDDEGFPAVAMLDGRPDTGWAKIYGGGGTHTAVFTLAESLAGGPGTKLIVRIQHSTRPRLAIGKFRLSLASVDGADLSAQALPDKVLAAIRKDAAQRTPEEKTAIAAHYRQVAPETVAARQRLAKLEGERSVLLGQIPKTLVSEATSPRDIRILPRGNWMDDSGSVVLPAVPAFLSKPAATPVALRAPETPANVHRLTRLDLANWIVAPENPLTARVFVNRLWKLFYGVGIAKNVDDFGAQGEPPVHPELLDWLASEFMGTTTDHGRPTTDHGPAMRGPSSVVGRRSSHPWDIKHLVRLMVTSATYQQTSAASPALVARDPYNRLYARQSSARLDAEFVRDVALAAAGMLSETVGGRSVYPYEPRGYLAPLNFPRREWAPDSGEALYRRGLYTFWQRSFLHPSLLAFDAPSREECTASRTVSDTPMQALVLLNDPIFVEASRVFGERIMRHGGPTFEARLKFAWEAALSRPPSPPEAQLAHRLLDEERARYAKDPKAARELISAGEWPVAQDLDPAELAAWSSVARVILNLHETITRS